MPEPKPKPESESEPEPEPEPAPPPALGVEPPRELVCPLSFKLLVDAVSTSTGQVFDDKAIRAYVDSSAATKNMSAADATRQYVCPMTREHAWRKEIRPIYLVRSMAAAWLAANPGYSD